ncbi:hypothetical protein RBY4I_1898 [Rhodobacterales bacterium Y4I]|nr:hypothetical protein RBY4I_1898 [Rhodobacterales bacterium Y4I]
MGAVLDYCRFPALCREIRACVFRCGDAPVRTSAIDLPPGAAGNKCPGPSRRPGVAQVGSGWS